MQVDQLRNGLVQLGATIISDERLEGVVSKCPADDCKQVNLNPERNPDFSMDEFRGTLRNTDTDVTRVARGVLADMALVGDNVMLVASSPQSPGILTRSCIKCFIFGGTGNYMHDMPLKKTA